MREDAGADVAAAGELRRIRRILGWLLVLAAFAAVAVARAVLLPVVLAVVLTLTLRPAARALNRLGLPHAAAALLLCAGLGLGAGALAYAASGPLSQLVADAPAVGQELRWKLRGLLASLEHVREASQEVERMAAGNEAGGTADPVVISDGGLIGRAAASLAGTGTSLMLALVLATFLLASGDHYHARIVESAPSLTDKKRALTIVRDVERQVSRYLGAITVINAGLGAAIGGTLWAIGLPNAAIWGLAMAVLNFVPFVGPAAGILGVTAAAVVGFDTPGQAVLCPLALIALTAFEGNVLTPTIVGRRLDVNTVAVLLTVLLWGWLWGVAGAVLAVPVLVIVKVVADNVPGLETLSRFLAPTGPERPFRPAGN